MKLAELFNSKETLGLSSLILVQIFCAGFFMLDALSDFFSDDYTSIYHLYIEFIAALVLWLSVYVEVRQLLQLLRRQAHLEAHYRQSQLTLHEVMVANFNRWELSPAEYDVAMFLFKGCSPSEIAEMRGTSDGTVKAQLSAIYRKAGVQNRAELMMGVIDDIYSKDLSSESEDGSASAAKEKGAASN